MLYAFEHFELDTEAFELRLQGKHVSLEPQTFNVLSFLVENNDRIVSKDELLQELWQGRIISESTLNTCIKAARKAVGDDGKSQSFIATYYSRGYRFISPVVTVDKTKDDVQAPSSTSAVLGTQQAQPYYIPYHKCPSIHVFPFTCCSDNADTEWMAKLFTESVSVYLAKLPGYRVISGANLQGDSALYQITGIICEQKQDIHYSIKLMEAHSGEILWTKQGIFTSSHDPHTKQTVMRKVATAIVPELGRADLLLISQKTAILSGGWESYRLASSLLGYKGWNTSAYTQALELTRQAIRDNSNLAFTHAYLSHLLLTGFQIGLLTDEHWENEAKNEAEIAIEIDNRDPYILAYAGCTLAHTHHAGYTRGLQLTKQALQLDPEHAYASIAMGMIKLKHGIESGIDDFQQGVRMSHKDKNLALWYSLLAQAQLSLGYEDKALNTARRACNHDDKILFPRMLSAIILSRSNQDKDAKLAWQDVLRVDSDVTAKASLPSDTN